MEKEKKSCQYCGEEILATAIKCKHCSSLLGVNKNTIGAKAEASISSVESTSNENHNPKPSALIELIEAIWSVIVAALILGGLYYWSLYEPTYDGQPTIAVSISEFEEEFRENEGGATSKYIDKWISLTGVLADTSVIGNTWLMDVGEGTGFFDYKIGCELTNNSRSDLSFYQIGDTVTVVGTLDDYLFLNVNLKQCEFIR